MSITSITEDNWCQRTELAHLKSNPRRYRLLIWNLTTEENLPFIKTIFAFFIPIDFLFQKTKLSDALQSTISSWCIPQTKAYSHNSLLSLWFLLLRLGREDICIIQCVCVMSSCWVPTMHYKINLSVTRLRFLPRSCTERNLMLQKRARFGGTSQSLPPSSCILQQSINGGSAYHEKFCLCLCWNMNLAKSLENRYHLK